MAVCLHLATGCAWSQRRAVWYGAQFAPVRSTDSEAPAHRQVVLRPVAGSAATTACATRPAVGPGESSSGLRLAEGAYKEAQRADVEGSESRVELYYRAARYGWDYLGAHQSAEPGDRETGRAWEIYHASVARLIQTGQQHKRWDPRRGLLVRGADGPSWIRVAYHDFPWQPEDFGRLEVFGGYHSKELSHVYRCEGLGVPLVAVRKRPCRCDIPCRLVPQSQPFAATAVLRFDGEACGQTGPVLELFDPMRTSRVETASFDGPVARDLTAPLAYSLNRDKRTNVVGFLQPGGTDVETRLYMIEPYQRGKIPIVFVHGLLSDPSTWYDLANELRGRPELSARYQIWAFEYSTGKAFLESAAQMRSECRKIVAELDPKGSDPALRQMVLVGHSMGGLVSKLQVTASDGTLWNAAAKRPLESIRASEKQRARLDEMFHFEPLPCVTRVVFIATPHRGSSWANRPVGEISSAMVQMPEEVQKAHDQLVEDNPGVFSDEIQKRPPTSIDLLDPNSPLLKAMLGLRVGEGVRLHSIIGDDRIMLRDGPGDGVVPVSSALLPGVASQRIVPASHDAIHHHPKTVEELVNILRRHVAEFDQEQAAGPPPGSGNEAEPSLQPIVSADQAKPD